MATLTSNSKKLWQAQGVSILPKDPNELLPLVGQRPLYNKLREFREECMSDSTNKISNFFVLDGAWGVGKSRVGHELCLEALFDGAKWIVDGKPQRVLNQGFEDGILPLFVRYSQVTKGKFGEDLNADNWIAASIVEALKRLSSDHQSTQELGKNQDKLMKWTEEALKPKGWDKVKPQLAYAVDNADPAVAARYGLTTLKEVGIKHLMIIVDEIEDVSDVERDGLESDEREGIDQVLLTVIPRVIKSEEIRQVFPEVSFLLLCSRAVGDNLRQIHAIDRRTMRHEIQTNAFSDVQDFFTYLKAERPDLSKDLDKYPEGLKEAAFFAADRNFGWFNVIMSKVHTNAIKDKNQPVHSLMRKFADTTEKVFNEAAIGEWNVHPGANKEFIENAMYGLLPIRIGTDVLGSDKADELIQKRNVEQKPLFARLLEIKPPQPTRIMTHLLNCGFKIEQGTIVVLPGQARFDVKEVIDSIRSYSQIAKCIDDHLLICESQSEFLAQVEALSAHGDQAVRFANYLHGLFTDPTYEVKVDGLRSEFLAPSFTFLQAFHQLNRRRNTDQGMLLDGTKNSELIEAFDNAKKDPTDRIELLLQGFANIWQQEPIQTDVASECQQIAAISFTPPTSPLNLGWDSTCVFAYGSNVDDAAIETDLGKIAKRGAIPVVLILEDAESTRIEELEERITRNVPRIAPFLVIHNITRQVAEYIAKLGLMGDVYEKDALRTSQFNATILDARQHLERKLHDWSRDTADSKGLVISPLFYGSKVSDDDLAALARGYSAMLSGKSFHDVMQRGNDIFESEIPQDAFKKMAERQSDPGPKYADFPRLNLIVDESGELVAQVPRCLLAIMERCAHVPLKRSELEKKFFYDQPEANKTKEVIRHLTDLMHHLGLIAREGDTVKQVSSHSLKSQVNDANNWLDGPFDTAAAKIKRINNDEGARLIDIQAKKARQGLKEATKELDDLDLAFVKEDWDELNKLSADGMPNYEQHLKKSLKVIGKVRDAVRSVFVADANTAFQYSPDYLDDFEKNQSSDSYPLWKRVKILEGFYASVETQRRELIRIIEDTLKDVDSRVPELDDGQKAFPTLALSRPLQAFRQELDFGADRPGKTVTAGGSSYAIKTVGYKISDHKYREAQHRIEEIRAELTQPGKIVAGFNELLKSWQGLCDASTSLRTEIDKINVFFDDAPDEVKQQAGLARIRGAFNQFEQAVSKGGIRHGTEDREAAGANIFSLVEGLKKDLDQIRNNSTFSPSAIWDDLDGLEAQSVQTLEIKYQSEHAALMRAWTGVRLAQADPNKGVEGWPGKVESTFGKTKELFESHVVKMREEGEACFANTSGTSFENYVGLCQKLLDDQKIDWDTSEYEQHINNLKSLKLLELKLK